ncbi:MAG: hypothetical protein AB4426_11985 [Xenococcaceae cyanobacterium]
MLLQRSAWRFRILNSLVMDEEAIANLQPPARWRWGGELKELQS